MHRFSYARIFVTVLTRRIFAALVLSSCAIPLLSRAENPLPLNSLQRRSHALPQVQAAPGPALALLAAPLLNEAGAAWNSATSCPVAIAHYAFAQNGNSLYVISGFSNGFPTTAVERYDATSNSWTSLAPITAGTEGPVAVFYNNKIYCADGYGASSQDLLRVYDVATNTWSAASVRPGVSDSYGSAIGAWNGKVYIVGGGSTGSTPVVSVYDIASGTWSAGPQPPQSFYFGGYAQIGQYLYLAGGFASTIYVNSDVTMRLDLATGTWSVGPTFTPKRGDFGLAAAGTRLYAMGGDTDGGDYFDPSAQVDELETASWPQGSWIASPQNLPSVRLANEGGFYTTAISGGEIWSTGGFTTGDVYLNDHLFRSVPRGATTVLSAVSRKTHGSAGPFDLALPLTGPAALEPRSGGASGDYTIVVNFASPVSITGFPQAKVSSGIGMIGTASASSNGGVIVNGTSVTIPLTNVANAQVLRVTLQGVTGGGSPSDITIPIRLLVGDVNGDATVNSADAALLRNRSGQLVTTESFPADLNADGAINSADASIARSLSGSSVPPPTPVSVVSRKAHGVAGIFDLPITLSGGTSVECRSGGTTGDYQIVLTFANAVSVTGAPQALVSSGHGNVGLAGSANGGAVTVSGSTVTVPLTNVTTAQLLDVTLHGVTDGNTSGDILIPIRVLVGDVNGDGTVNSGDVTLVGSQSGLTTGSSNYRADVNVDGTINSGDSAIVRAQSGTGVSPDQ